MGGMKDGMTEVRLMQQSVNRDDPGYRCTDCPRKCSVLRTEQNIPGLGAGFCEMGNQPVIARVMLHHWEEPCISGTRGSGTIFFSGCNLKCVFCQNEQISHANHGRVFTGQELAVAIETLVRSGAHNINLVTAAHFTRSIAGVLRELKQGGLLEGIPVIYNTSAYEETETLKLLEGIVDVYLPDMKFSDDRDALKYAGVHDYVAVSRMAVLEMFRQVGLAQYDENGLIYRGIMIRHLILPGLTEKSIAVIRWISEHLPNEVAVSIMSQYLPSDGVKESPEFCGLNRKVTKREYKRVLDYLYQTGLQNGYVQDVTSASAVYIPDFSG